MFVILNLFQRVLNVFKRNRCSSRPTLYPSPLCLVPSQADLYRLHQPDLLDFLLSFWFSQWEASDRKERTGEERIQNIYSSDAVKRT